MAEIRRALKELRTAVTMFKLFDVLLTSLVVFMASLFFTNYAGLRWYFCLIPWGLWLSVQLPRRAMMKGFGEVEEKVPLLRDALSTAADSVGQDSQIVKELQKEVLSKMHAIHTSNFLGFGKTTKILLALTVISYLIIGMSAFDVNAKSTSDFVARQNAWQSVMSAFTQQKDNQTDVPDAAGKTKRLITKDKLSILQDNSSLYGTEHEIEIGATPIELTVDPLNTGANLKDERAVEEKKFRTQEAGEISASNQQACGAECTIPLESQQLVKSYFEKVATP